MEESTTLLHREEIKNYEIEDVPDNQLEGSHLTVVNLVLKILDKPIIVICPEIWEIRRFLNVSNYWQRYINFNWWSHGGLLDQTIKITHKIIKTETKHMTLQKIKELADSEKLSLFATIDENHLHSNFIDDQIIFEE